MLYSGYPHCKKVRIFTDFHVERVLLDGIPNNLKLIIGQNAEVQAK